ncbi:hypothetical protein SBA6_1340014 [Candidatus Sulfopaludibacter sp. SbA6]|nr:hypothetical protein SBA6_1340014 [Candidatus Sulfopaludibacter sp. SbA6]
MFMKRFRRQSQSIGSTPESCCSEPLFVGFAAAYIGLLYEFVAVFLPFLKPFRRSEGD